MITQYISIPYLGKEKKTDNILDAMEHISNQFPGNKLHYVPVAAFGVCYTAYIDNTNNEDWIMECQCGAIIYYYEESDGRKYTQRNLEIFNEQWKDKIKITK